MVTNEEEVEPWITVAWLDDRIHDYPLEIANLTYNRISCLPCRRIHELLEILGTDIPIDVVIVDKALDGKEKGDKLVPMIQRSHPNVGLLVYSIKTVTRAATDKNPIGHLQKSLQVSSQPGEPDALTLAVRAAHASVPARSRALRSMTLVEKVMLVPWDFVLTAFMLLRRPIVLAAIVALGALQLAPSAQDISVSAQNLEIYTTLKLVFMRTWYVFVPLALALVGYIAFCPDELRGKASRESFARDWIPKYLINPADELRIKAALADAVAESHSRDRDALVNVHAFFERLRVSKPVRRYLVVALGVSALVGNAYSSIVGLTSMVGGHP